MAEPNRAPVRLPERATMTVAETARVLGIHRDTAYDAVRRGDIGVKEQRNSHWR